MDTPGAAVPPAARARVEPDAGADSESPASAAPVTPRPEDAGEENAEGVELGGSSVVASQGTGSLSGGAHPVPSEPKPETNLARSLPPEGSDAKVQDETASDRGGNDSGSGNGGEGGDEDPFRLQKLVKGKLIEQRLTQNKLSKALGIGVSSLSRWLNGLTAKMNQAYLMELDEIMLAWVENRERRKIKTKACWPGKGRKLCLSCKTVVRSNAIECKKCGYSFLESERRKLQQAAIEWPEHLRRPRNESSRKAAEARRRNRELGLPPKSAQARAARIHNLSTRNARSNFTKTKHEQKEARKSSTTKPAGRGPGPEQLNMAINADLASSLRQNIGEELDWSYFEHQGAQTDPFGSKFYQRIGGEGGGVGSGCGVLPSRALDD